MTPDIALLFATVLAMAILFFTELLPVDLTAFLGLLALVYLGLLSPEEGFSGFSSPAVITMLSVFFITAAIVNTGLADQLAGRIYKMVGGNELVLIAAIMAIAGLLSAFIFNVAATAVLMPAVVSLARQSGTSPSRLLMPLCFAAVLGGTLTMIGTPPNIISSEILQKAGFPAFTLFDFTPIGVAILLSGTAYMLFFGRRWLPNRDMSSEFQQRSNLAQTYQIQENLFAIKVPPQARLAGRTLRESRLSTSFGVQVLAIKRGGRNLPAPEAEFLLEAGDLMMVQGNLAQLQDLLRVQDVMLGSTETRLLDEAQDLAVCLARLRSGHPWIGSSAATLGLRPNYHLTLAGLKRGEGFLQGDLARIRWTEGDELLVVGGPEIIKALYGDPQLEIVAQQSAAMTLLRSQSTSLRIPPSSALVGLTLAESKLGHLIGVTVVALVRAGHVHLAQNPQERIQPEDQLLVCGDLEKVRNLLDLGDLLVESNVAHSQWLTDEIGMVELTLAPRSRAAGKSLAELRFRDNFGVQVIGLWREGQALPAPFAYRTLRMGDALLIQGSWPKIKLLGMDPDFVVLSTGAHAARATRKAPVALGALLLMIGLVLTHVQPINVAAFSAAALVLLFRAVSSEEAYRSVEWRVLFITASILPLGICMERTGAAQLLADQMISLSGPHGPYALLLALTLLASILSQSLDGAPAVVLIAPIALRTAAGMGVSPQPFIAAIALGASAAFMTPFSHKAHLLVMGAGGYTVKDYLRIGTPLTLLFLALVVLLTPLLFPFNPA
jgi:di/tricarboxylate transporter